MSAPKVDRTHRERAESLAELSADSFSLTDREFARIAQRAQVHAQLAQVDAIEALTAVLAGMEFPALEVSGSVIKGTCRIRPVER